VIFMQPCSPADRLEFFVYPAMAGTESKSLSGLAPPKLREGDA
jgi:hypothetical protein